MQLWPATLAAILGGTQSAGAPNAAIAESHTIPASTPYTVPLTNASTMVAGSEIVVVTVAGQALFYTRVAAGMEAAATAAAPTSGKYSIASGILTFVTGDAGETVQITYLYTPVSNTGTTVAIQQVGMNTAPTFELTLIGLGKNIYTNAAQQFIVRMNSCLAPSLSLGFKLDDFTSLDVDYQAFIDANGNLGSFYLVNPG
jgi:hypothetical protein